MPHTERSVLEQHLERVELPKGLTIGNPKEPSSYSYFPVIGVASIAVRAGRSLQLDVAMFGSDGMSDPWEHLTGVKSPFHTLMLSHGHGYRAPTHIVSDIARVSDEFRMLLGRFAQTLSVQFGCTAMAGACLPIERRLARWLLMISDRTAGETLEFTHGAIADQLRVRRQSVTTALHVLDGLGLIKSERRLLTIKNRMLLMEFAGEAYGTPEAEYLNFFPTSRFPRANLADVQPAQFQTQAKGN